MSAPTSFNPAGTAVAGAMAMAMARVVAAALALVVSCGLCGCGNDSGDAGSQAASSTAGSTLSCVPASVRQCPCLHGGTGTQSCAVSGDSYGPCTMCPLAPPPQMALAGGGAEAPLDAGLGELADGSTLDAADAAAATAGGATGPDGPDAGQDAGGPSLESVEVGTSCGVGLPVLCELETQKCCARSLRTDTCIDVAASCTCELADCTVMEAHCDGPEDCPGDQVCCGTLVGGSSYERFECVSSCDFAGLQRIACHQAASECPAGTECANSQLLTNVQVCIDPETIRQ